MTVVDIAGLVRGASQGAGLGNAFLSNVASVDAIYHLVRAFENDDITHVENNIDPVRDLEIIQNELRIKDEEMLERQLLDLAKLAKFPDAKKLPGTVSKKEELVRNEVNERDNADDNLYIYMYSCRLLWRAWQSLWLKEEMFEKEIGAQPK